MRSRLFILSARRKRALADAAAAAYIAWLHECAAVRLAWVNASKAREAVAFTQYEEALDREEYAARVYSRLMRRARHLEEVAVACRLARIEAGAGAL